MTGREMLEILKKFEAEGNLDLPVYTDYVEEGGEAHMQDEVVTKEDHHDCGALCMEDNGLRFINISSHH